MTKQASTTTTTTTSEPRKRGGAIKGTALILVSLLVLLGVHSQIGPQIISSAEEKRKLSSPSSSTTTPTHQQQSVDSASSLLQEAIQQAPIGRLGPKNTNRHKLLYYDFLFLMSLKYGSQSKSLLEVGCSSDAFAQYLTWMDRRSCLAPYFVSYNNGKHKHALPTTQNNEKDGAATTNSLQHIQADFMKWDNPNHQQYDLVVCNQVLEHVPDPKAFLQKLITTAQQTTIVSVPYMWADCGKSCGHLHHEISLKKLLEWSHPYQPIHHSIIIEPNDKAQRWGRLFAVFQKTTTTTTTTTTVATTTTTNNNNNNNNNSESMK